MPDRSFPERSYFVRLRPSGPWRLGPTSGARDRVDHVFHSDSLYSAITAAMEQLGYLSDWLRATAEAEHSAVRFSSCFPFTGEVLLVAPPRSVWPPAASAPAASAKVRWKGARFIPLTLVKSLCAEEPIDEQKWAVDPNSECLLPVGSGQIRAASPFRVDIRTSAAVDRLNPGGSDLHSTACLEFAPDSGMWCIAQFDEALADVWEPRVKEAFRLLADTGIGGERSRGWGRFAAPDFEPAPSMALPAEDAAENGFWLLSLFSPAESDTVDWERGNYTLIERRGRIESRAQWGTEKLFSRMVEEGSVLLAGSPPGGRAQNVAPDGFPHPVFRAGFAVTVPVTVPVTWRSQA